MLEVYMAGTPLRVPWGKESLGLVLPQDWQIRGVLEPAALPPVADMRAEVERGLSEPVGSPRLCELGGPAMRVVIVIDDSSRPTPVSAVLPLVLKELERGGVRKDQITLVPALGIHRGMEEAELSLRAGAENLAGLRWENPDCDDESKMAFLGTTSRGTPVWINKTTADAGLIVSIGCIEPHIIASFGGGYKNLIPGVAGRLTIGHNHAINCAPATFNNVGRPIENNPMRLDLEEGARMLQGKVFIANTILNHRQELVRLVAGDPIAAHRAGVQVSAGLYGVKVERPADIVITSSNPMDIDLRQGVKALANTVRAVKPGGVMITVVRAEEGTGVFGLANRKLPLGRGGFQLLGPILLPLIPRLKLKNLGEEDRFFLYFALQAMQHALLLMYAPTIPSLVQERLPFIRFVAQAQEAVEQARRRFPGKAEVLVFPHGGITYPDMN
jgi:lactate racemase